MRLESLLKFRRSGDATTAEVRVGRQVVCIDVSYEDGSRATVVLDHAEMDQLAEAWLARQTAGIVSGQEKPAAAGAIEAGAAHR
jgi:hypothetical protein